ncbi:DNA cytosine methyltransferase [Phaeospirillum tilakii]|uniref:DNA (cytosine-5-)-methyltransferase n=1 Tax=Phaeospirillum tilakii TaxID=741673 RepID=A0ABW5CFJ6_9PROT
MPGLTAMLPLDLPRQPATPSRRPRPAKSRGDALHDWPLQGGINVVLFAGMGGACQGLEAAGYPVHLAVNHDEVAIAAHRALNPHTRHMQADIFEVDPLLAVRGRRVGQLWASPDCRDHSVAKGGAPRSPRVRSMPWQVCRWVGVLRRRGLGPEVVYLENVREIRGWGPLIAKRDRATGRVLKLDGTVAAPGERVPVREQQLVRDPRRAGRTYRAWVRHMERLGATYEDRDLCCADFGVPTTRKRLFGVAHFDGRRPVWPEPTHAQRDSEAVRAGRLLPHVPAASIIDWSLPLPSIFDRPRPLAPATLRRIAVGMRRFVLEAERPFLIRYHGERRPGENARAQELGAAMPTQTTENRFGVVSVAVIGCGGRSGQVPPMDVGDALNTSTTKEDRCVLAAHLIQTGYGEREGQAPRALDVERPIGTMVAGGGKHAAVGAWMVQHNTGVIGHDAADGLSTMTTLGTQQQVAGAFLVHQRGTGTATSPADAARTLTTGGGRGGDHIGVGAAFLTEYYGTGGQHCAADEALNTLSTVDRFAVTRAATGAPPLPADQLARARQVAEFLRAHGVWSGGEVVTLGPWVIVEIGMRMLRPEEVAAAHELRMPAAITLPKRDRQGAIVTDVTGAAVLVTRPLTKTEAMRLIGNSVPKRMALLLAQANGPRALERMEAAE